MNRKANDREATDPWGAHAATYDRVYTPLTGQVGRSLLAMVEQRMRPGSTVLDIACGSGALLIPALERAERLRVEGNTDFVVGCDYSEGMVESARRKAGATFASEIYRCDVENGQALSYSDASFDAVFSCFGIFLFEDRRAGWREAARVLSPGGLFATSTWMSPEQNEWFRAQYGPVFEALPARVKEQLPTPGWLEVASPEGLRAEVEEAGFTEVEVHPFDTTFVLPERGDGVGRDAGQPRRSVALW